MRKCTHIFANVPNKHKEKRKNYAKKLVFVIICVISSYGWFEKISMANVKNMSLKNLHTLNICHTFAVAKLKTNNAQ